MPHYVKIRNKKTGRELAISADVWKTQVERFKGKELEFEEIQPATVTIQRRSVNTNVVEPEKKSQVVATNSSIQTELNKQIVKDAAKSTEVELTPEIIKAEMEVKNDEPTKVVSEAKPEPKKRGRPFKK